MRIKVDWEYAEEEDEALDYCQVLYSYLHPKTQSILYIGKADRSTVRERLRGKHKKEIFEFMSSQSGLKSMSLQVGYLVLPEGSRYSSALLADVESLLISRVLPPVNIQSTQSRISRPGMVVTCSGEWPHRQRQFRDV